MNLNAYPYPMYSMTLNRYDDTTIKISLEFIRELEKHKPFTITTHDDIQSGRVKSVSIIGHCVFCQKISPTSNSMLTYQDNQGICHTYCICCDCIEIYDENISKK